MMSRPWQHGCLSGVQTASLRNFRTPAAEPARWAYNRWVTSQYPPLLSREDFPFSWTLKRRDSCAHVCIGTDSKLGEVPGLLHLQKKGTNILHTRRRYHFSTVCGQIPIGSISFLRMERMASCRGDPFF